MTSPSIPTLEQRLQQRLRRPRGELWSAQLFQPPSQEGTSDCFTPHTDSWNTLNVALSRLTGSGHEEHTGDLPVFLQDLLPCMVMLLDPYNRNRRSGRRREAPSSTVLAGLTERYFVGEGWIVRRDRQAEHSWWKDE